MDRKVIFDTVREILGRSLEREDVARLDRAIDRANSASEDGAVSDLKAPQIISPPGTALIKRFEGCARLRPDGLIGAYPDPGTGGAPWTIGWGATGPGIAPGTVWTQQQCDDRLAVDLCRYASDVTDALAGAPTTQAQFDALVCFHYILERSGVPR